MNMTPTVTTESIEEMLRTSAMDVFTTTLQLSACPAQLDDIRATDVPMVAGSVGFVGDLSAMCYFYVKAPFARLLASRMLGMAESEIEGDELVDDVIGELTNMIVGAVKSRLCDMGLSISLTIPSIVHGQHLSAHAASATECRIQSLICEAEPLLLELLIKPQPTQS